MSCTVDGCPPELLYATKASFQWHWKEKHLPEVISYTCLVGQCWVSCRRRYDMKVHLLRIHNGKKEFVESILSKSQRSSKPNPAYINQEPWTFFGRTSKPNSPPVLLNAVPISLNSVPESGTTTSVSSTYVSSLTSGSPSTPDSVPGEAWVPVHLSRVLPQGSVSCHCRSTSQETTIQLCDPWMFQHRPAVRTFLYFNSWLCPRLRKKYTHTCSGWTRFCEDFYYLCSFRPGFLIPIINKSEKLSIFWKLLLQKL